jgi:branched-chain amino acid transport system substrate-binding protein
MSVVLVFSMACDGNGGNGGTPTPGSTGIVGTIKIGGPCPLTGGYAAGGNELRFGYEQAMRDINARGGVNVAGQMYRLAITVLDDESDPTKTVSRMEALASQGVVCYTGSFSSETNAPAAGIAEKNRIPILAGSFSSLSPHLQGYQYLFSPFVKTDKGVEMIFELLDTLPADKKPSKIAVWSEKTDWGTELKTMVPDSARAHGYEVVVNDEYSEMTLDYSSLIIASKAAGAEVVIAVPTPVVALSMIKQMKEQDYSPEAAVFWRGAATSLWPANLGAIGDYALFISNWNWNFEYPGNADLVAVYRATENKLPTVTVGNGYAIVQIIVDAIQRAGSLDPTRIRDAIAATSNLMTVQGMITSFQANGVGECPAAIMQWQKQISQVVLHEQYESAEFMFPTPPWSQR